MRLKIITFLLILALFTSPVFATTEFIQNPEQNEVEEPNKEESSDEQQEPAVQEEPVIQEETEQPEISTAKIIKKGKYYYYQKANGKIRTTAGFVTLDGKKYYIRKGGKIRTSKTFKISKKYYRANSKGVILTGVYKWNKKLNYSYSSGQWKKSEGFVTWKNNKYYVKKGGLVVSNDGFTVKNQPYITNKEGHVEKIAIPQSNNDVVQVAKKQVGIMTGKTYWRWYYKTRFIDTDRTPWCGAFVAWCYNKAGHYNKISVAKKYGPLGYVPSYSKYANKYGKWVSKKNAKAGDIIVFGKNRHVGIVEGISGNYIVTIEGNAGPTAAIGCKKPGAVVRNIYKLTDKDIKGIIRP